MERKINLLIEYLYEFKDTITKAEVQKMTDKKLFIDIKEIAESIKSLAGNKNMN